MIILDGVYVEGSHRSPDRFQWVKSPTSEELAQLTQTIARRVGRFLERQARWPERIDQFHLVGGSDENVPVELVENAVSRQPDAHLLRYPKYTHSCCWAEVWPEILDKIQRD